jgi:hypothetical protein
VSEINKEHFREWVAALRSGKYEQGGLALGRVDNTFCCLGVACEVAGVPRAPGGKGKDCATYYYGEEGNSGSLPLEAQKWLGIHTNNPFVRHLGRERQLFILNDRVGLSFSQIADCIEQTYLPEDWEARQAAK